MLPIFLPLDSFNVEGILKYFIYFSKNINCQHLTFESSAWKSSWNLPVKWSFNVLSSRPDVLSKSKVSKPNSLCPPVSIRANRITALLSDLVHIFPDYLCHAYNRHDRLCCVLISDHEYPQRVAHTLLSRILDEFCSTVPNTKWQTKEEKLVVSKTFSYKLCFNFSFISVVAFPQLAMHLTKYQDPKQADALTKLQTELDETKVILHGTITSLLNRGEKLDDLVAKSDDLSAQSKVFYKTARKTTQCCSLV